MFPNKAVVVDGTKEDGLLNVAAVVTMATDAIWFIAVCMPERLLSIVAGPALDYRIHITAYS